VRRRGVRGGGGYGVVEAAAVRGDGEMAHEGGGDFVAAAACVAIGGDVGREGGGVALKEVRGGGFSFAMEGSTWRGGSNELSFGMWSSNGRMVKSEPFFQEATKSKSFMKARSEG
jgi:hypothetical protein